MSQIIKSSNSNGFIISLEESVNSNMLWNDMTDSFKAELESIYIRKELYEVSWETLVALYAEDLIRKYFETIGYVSYFTFNNICEDVYKTSVSITSETNVNHSCQLKFKVLFNMIINA